MLIIEAHHSLLDRLADQSTWTVLFPGILFWPAVEDQQLFDKANYLPNSFRIIWSKYSNGQYL